MNVLYEKMIADDYGKSKMTLADFIRVCDVAALPVFEVQVTNNPFAEPHRTTSAKAYNNMSEYRKTMPEWSGREYDYQNDRCAGYYAIEGIHAGDFVLKADNSSSAYEWHFQVLDGCVVIHKKYWITD